MSRRIFIRNVQARNNLELFIVSAVSSLLLLRFYLHIAHYPQVGGGNLHIAHMLWGGALMLVSMLSLQAFLGQRVKRFAALVGGIGFGIFIDEIGKFLTKDNNYFFHPAVGIIYAIFVIIYLVTGIISRPERLDSREYQLNALLQLEEAVLNDMDQAEKTRVNHLLRQADQDSPITKGLQRFLADAKTIGSSSPGLWQRWTAWVDKSYQRLWHSRTSNAAVRIFFLAQIAVFGIGVLYTLFINADSIQDFFQGTITYGRGLVFGQLAGTLIATAFAITGALRLRQSRVDAFEFFRRATLTNLLLTEFFIFSRIQFGAMPSFIFNLALLLLINFVLTQERRLSQ